MTWLGGGPVLLRQNDQVPHILSPTAGRMAYRILHGEGSLAGLRLTVHTAFPSKEIRVPADRSSSVGWNRKPCASG